MGWVGDETQMKVTFIADLYLFVSLNLTCSHIRAYAQYHPKFFLHLILRLISVHKFSRK